MSSYLLPDGTIPVLLSSDHPDLLRREATALLGYLREHPGVQPGAVADMLFRTRTPRRHRALAMVGDRAELLAALESVAAGDPHPSVIASDGAAKPRRIGYVFPGQGSQRPGMGRMLYQHSEAFRTAVDECQAVFDELFGISPRAYILAEEEVDDDVKIVQPALFMQMIGLAAMWRAAGVDPAATVGHSQGEISAAVVSGLMSLADGVRVVTLRANLVDSLGLEGYSMAVVGVDRDECEALLARYSGWAELSVVNSAHVLAISGDRSAILHVVETLTARGTFAKEIRVAYPAHTSFVSKFRDEFCTSLTGKLDSPDFAATSVTCFGATLGAPITPDLPVGDYWYWNLRNRVRFDQAVAEATAEVDTFVEIADHPALLLAMQETLSTVPDGLTRGFQTLGTSRRTATDLREFTRSLATVAVNDANYTWGALRAGPIVKRPPLLDFPNTQWNSKPMWAPFEYVTDPAAEAEFTATPLRAREEWVRLERRRQVPPRTLKLIDSSGENAELIAAIGDGAGRFGAKIVSDGDATAFDTAVVFLPADGDLAASFAEFATTAWLPALDGVQNVWLVTAGGEAVVPGDEPDLFHAAAQAGFRCLALEHLGVSFRHVDLLAAAALPDAAKAVLSAVHTADEPEIAFRGDGVYAKRLTADPVETSTEPVTAREIVIIGGTGKIGLDCCEHFARTGAARITLVSRSGGNDEAAERIRRIARDTSAEIVVRTADITDTGSLEALATAHGAHPIDLLIHAAVDYTAAAATPTPEAVAAAVAAKVGALDDLLGILPLASDARILLCSSLSATIGGRGHLLYAAVNRMLDVAATRRRAAGVACSSVQWGLWREVGADHADALAAISATGLFPMNATAAIEAGFHAPAGNHLVVAADWSRIAELFGVYGFAPLFTELEEIPAPVMATPRAAGGSSATAAAATVDTPAAPAEASTPAEPAQSDNGTTAERVRFALRTVMGLGAGEAIDGSTPLVALGLDSLQALDLRKRIAVDLKRDLPVTAILGGASFDEVVALLGT
ncbi:nocobactin polyketide synthase NbtC [Nocardia sp. 2]|uniref:Nocobactin polyketide synthase NbtC n=1 Tax=Nocardia acididurans TaxID=2802282 RepID=A0ABS1M9E8_9NOCA|nr:nocobactin polyketide synthase NbtC [Nocardia acididurans]MBL1077221.1 nocobactin polyketide synthase NbtC [Nocardia acididurans]